MSKESENPFLTEWNKWKKFEENILLMITNCKDNCKREEKLTRILEKNVDDLNNSNSNITEKVKSEVYNKYFTAHNIFKLGGLSEQITDSWEDIKGLLVTFNKLQQECESNLKKYKDKISRQKNANEDLLKLLNNDIESLKKEERNINEAVIAEKEKQTFELDHIKKLQEDIANKVGLLTRNHHLENNVYENEIKNIESEKVKITEAINKKNQVRDLTLASAAELEIKTNQEIEILNEIINIMLKKYEDVNTKIENCKRNIEEQENNNNNLFEKNIVLEFASKWHQEKSFELEQCIIEEETKFLQSRSELNNYINALSNDIQNKKAVLLEEKERETNCGQTEENSIKDLESKIENLNYLKSNSDSLDIKKNNLIHSINEEVKSIETSSKIYEECNIHLKNLKCNIQELNDTNSNSALEYKNISGKLIKELEDSMLKSDMRKKELEASKLKYYAEIDIAQSDELMNYNAENKKLENELDDMKKHIEAIKQEKEQILINLESKTLECDILSRKIKTAEGVQNSLREELKPKPIIKELGFLKKRHLNETSDSSFDGNMTFQQRLLMKKKKKKDKIPSAKT